jgi:uncharacterized protein YyaL (SSP411 family)
VVRPVDVFDGALPSANSVAATALIRLGALTGDAEATAAGTQLLATLVATARRHPLALANVVLASGCVGGAAAEVVVAGDRSDLLAAVRRRYEPTTVVAWGERGDGPLWQGRGDGRAYVCRNSRCRLPAITVADLESQLDAELDADRAALAMAAPRGHDDATGLGNEP